uniref:Transmembrane p24 trafficking protein 3 n=1 Tax=Erpetoichthys calabaricus TaxID=27687 RepID=A0A8C4SIT9_ERPCA
MLAYYTCEKKQIYKIFFVQSTGIMVPNGDIKGVYKCCFSNEFSTFSHKTVYFDFQGGNDPPIVPEMLNRITALTLKESSCVTIHEALKTISDSQTHYRLRETIILCVVSISQVVMLRSFFTDKNASLGVST